MKASLHAVFVTAFVLFSAIASASVGTVEVTSHASTYDEGSAFTTLRLEGDAAKEIYQKLSVSESLATTVGGNLIGMRKVSSDNLIFCLKSTNQKYHCSLRIESSAAALIQPFLR